MVRYTQCLQLTFPLNQCFHLNHLSHQNQIHLFQNQYHRLNLFLHQSLSCYMQLG